MSRSASSSGTRSRSLSPNRPRRGHKPVYYSEYLKLDQILNSQKPHSALSGTPAHEEHLFIIVHQVYELWFKQILHELDSCIDIFSKESVPEKMLLKVVARLKRITEIQRVLVDQLRVLETMTPGDFLDFRDYLFPASGFQSVQFKLIENKLGLQCGKRLNYNKKSYCSALKPVDQNIVKECEKCPSLFDLVERWLERTPYIQTDDFNFWDEYEATVLAMLEDDEKQIKENSFLSDDEKQERLQSVQEAREMFADVFDEERYEELRKKGRRRLSHHAFKMAVSISLLREEPLFQMPFQLITLLVDIDEQMTIWRSGHADMVHRMLGMKLGTGGSSGFLYLKSTATQHKIFSDFNNVSMYLIPSTCIPYVPEEVLMKMHFHSNTSSKDE